VFGAINSVQFTVMNTLTLKDLTPELASSGNSLLSMVQMGAMSFGVAGAAAMLTSFTQLLEAARPDSVLRGFHATFLTVGLITTASAWIFGQLSGEVRSQGEREETVDVPS
jgi:hypothetical protein